ncbi:MAG: VOC family protein [Candidatus Sedimenticola sp. 1PA]
MIELGHVVFYVRDLNDSLRFYHDMLGLECKGKVFDNRAAMMTGGRTHHELLLVEVGDAEGPLQGRRIGLYHTGWKIGDTVEELKAMHNRIEEFGYQITGMSDHWISKSIYLRDPDGNEIEVYVDSPDYDWHNDDRWINEPVRPLVL